MERLPGEDAIDFACSMTFRGAYAEQGLTEVGMEVEEEDKVMRPWRYREEGPGEQELEAMRRKNRDLEKQVGMLAGRIARMEHEEQQVKGTRYRRGMKVL